MAEPGATQHRLEATRAALHAERARLLGELAALDSDELALASAQRLEGGIAGDTADIVSDLAALQIDEALEQVIRQRLADVEAALHRLDAHAYGQCEICAQPIDPARLHAMPWARRCLACQQRAEHATAPRASPPDELVSSVVLPEQCPYCQGDVYSTEPQTDEDGVPTGLLAVHCTRCGRILAQVTPSEWALAMAPAEEEYLSALAEERGG